MGVKIRSHHILMVALSALAIGTPVHSASLHGQVYEQAGNSVQAVAGANGPLVASVSGANPGLGTSSNAQLLVDYGIHKISSSTSSSLTFLTSSNAQSTWIDGITLTAASSGKFRIALDLSASLLRGSGFGVANSSFGYNLNYFTGVYSLEGNLLGTNSSGALGETVLDSGSNIRRIVTLDIPFTSGVAIPFRSEASCQTVGQVALSCDAGGSFYWAGIVGVFDLNDQSITNWSVSSESGTDYQNSFAPGVPDGPVWAMMIIGFGWIGSVLRRRRPDARSNALATTL